jgi:hypothetical protein
MNTMESILEVVAAPSKDGEMTLHRLQAIAIYIR